MKYLLMMSHAHDPERHISAWPKEDIHRHIAFMRDLAMKLAANGELAAAEGLAGPEQAVLVRAGAQGEVITDGVFPETKEFLAGYWIVEVPSRERALAIAAEASAAPGVHGRPLNMPIEVRQVLTEPPAELLA